MKRIVAMIIALTMLAAIVPTFAKEGDGGLTAKDLTVEFLSDPIGLDAAAPFETGVMGDIEGLFDYGVKDKTVYAVIGSGDYVFTVKNEEEQTMKEHYDKGNFVNTYSELDKNSRAWRDGMISGNGETGYVTSGSPYNDSYIFQNMYFNYPSSQPRYIPAELPTQLEDARLNVFNLNDSWEIKGADGSRRSRTFYYSFHPGHQLRLKSDYIDTADNYVRWTNYETAETGVSYEDKYGTWERTAFTSRTDGVSITKIAKSSDGELINMTLSIDDISAMCKSNDGLSAVSSLRYKKVVPADASYIAQIVKYPAYTGSELYDGGYCGVTYIIACGENAKKTRVAAASSDSTIIGENYAVKIDDAEAVYLVTALDRTFEMTGTAGDVMTKFASMTSYDLLDSLVEKTRAVANKYTRGGFFSYDEALAPSAAWQSAEFNRVSFELAGDEEYSSYDNNALIDEQKGLSGRINHEFMRRAYNQARYAEICCGGTSAPRLYAMWTGEWNPGWRGIYTLDANVNLQVSPMNTGNLTNAQTGYISFFLRHSPDFMENAHMAYGMHDALQPSVNVDADRGMHVEYDNAYPFEYWNAGASWCLLPIYEYWQCFGNRQIPINDYMRFDDLQKVLGVEDGGLSDEEFAALKARGYLDLERDILLPLLTKQANFWEQIVTPRYYIDANGSARHDESKTELYAGEKYMIIPTYSPENHPIGYNSTITANATMDIAAARDGLDMVCAIEKAVGREGSDRAIAKWQDLKSKIADYKYDSDGALREWAMSEYTENNNHRHLSHLYVAWPGYETRKDSGLAEAANIALDNRNKYNTGDATAGHGWMHKALVEARLGRGDGMVSSLLKMMNGTAYYSSLMTDHDTNRRNDTYCTDTAFGTLGAVNEALVFSNTGEIEILPALPSDWTAGEVEGLMARTRVEVSELKWNVNDLEASATLTSLEDENTIRLSCGAPWTRARANGETLEVNSDEFGKFVTVTLDKDAPLTVDFTLDYSAFEEELVALAKMESVEAFASAGNDANLATDGDISTAFNVSGQTEASAPDQYIMFALDGSPLKKIVLKKQKFDGTYWQDWCFGVGCELQGSYDGGEWEKIAAMNTWPDGTDNLAGEEITLPEAKPYNYVRYIRTYVKKSGDYAYWKWSSGDGGNRLNIAEIEFYTVKDAFDVKITDLTENSATVRVRSTADAKLNVIAAVYSGDNSLLSVRSSRVEVKMGEPLEKTLEISHGGRVAVFLWGDGLVPVAKKISR